MMDHFQHKKDAEGKYWFAIPVHDSSREDEVLQLEKIIFRDWLKQKILHLKNYSGCWIIPVATITVWESIMFQLGRNSLFRRKKKQLEQKIQRSGFTWPEGNARLAKHFSKYTEEKSLQNHLFLR
jgi:hypothetical protein